MSPHRFAASLVAAFISTFAFSAGSATAQTTVTSERPASFKMGRAYDIQRVGIASQQAGNHVITTTGCDQLNSGNSRCGHEFGTKFSAEDKAALLEYLKML